MTEEDRDRDISRQNGDTNVERNSEDVISSLEIVRAVLELAMTIAKLLMTL